MRLHPASPDDVNGRAVMFGGGGGGTTSTNTIQNTSPWAGQQGYLTGNSNPGWAALGNGNDIPSSGGPGVFPAAQSLYTQYTPQYYPDQTVAGMNDEQNQAMGDTWTLASTGGGAALQAGQAGTANLASGSQVDGSQPVYNQSQGTLSSLLGSSMLPAATNSFDQAQGGLSSILGAGLDPNSNPYLQQAQQNTIAATLPGIESSFAGGGRLDSGLASQAAAQGVTQALGNLNYGQYNTNVGNTLNAAGAANSAAGTAAGTALSAAGQAGTNLNNATSNQVRADAIAPTYDAQTLNDIAASFNSGSAQQQQQQADINAAVQKWNYGQNLPYNMLGTYAGLVNGNYGSSSNSLSTQPYTSSGTANLLAGVGALGSAAGGLAATGAFGAGGWLTGASGLLSFSDRRLKTDIERIAETDDGLPIYSFRYRGSPRTEIGLMAQDVEKRSPEAVVTTPSGFKAVNYGLALEGGASDLISPNRKQGRQDFMSDMLALAA